MHQATSYNSLISATHPAHIPLGGDMCVMVSRVSSAVCDASFKGCKNYSSHIIFKNHHNLLPVSAGGAIITMEEVKAFF